VQILLLFNLVCTAGALKFELNSHIPELETSNAGRAKLVAFRSVAAYLKALMKAEGCTELLQT
jgi:hypothetical protein